MLLRFLERTTYESCCPPTEMRTKHSRSRVSTAPTSLRRRDCRLFMDSLFTAANISKGLGQSTFPSTPIVHELSIIISAESCCGRFDPRLHPRRQREYRHCEKKRHLRSGAEWTSSAREPIPPKPFKSRFDSVEETEAQSRDSGLAPRRIFRIAGPFGVVIWARRGFLDHLPRDIGSSL